MGRESRPKIVALVQERGDYEIVDRFGTVDEVREKIIAALPGQGANKTRGALADSILRSIGVTR